MRIKDKKNVTFWSCIFAYGTFGKLVAFSRGFIWPWGFRKCVDVFSVSVWIFCCGTYPKVIIYIK